MTNAEDIYPLTISNVTEIRELVNDNEEEVRSIELIVLYKLERLLAYTEDKFKNYGAELSPAEYLLTMEEIKRQHASIANHKRRIDKLHKQLTRLNTMLRKLLHTAINDTLE